MSLNIGRCKCVTKRNLVQLVHEQVVVLSIQPRFVKECPYFPATISIHFRYTYSKILYGVYLVHKREKNTSNKWSTLRWHHNGGDSVSNNQPHDCLLNRLFRRRSKKTSKLRVTGLCAGNSPGTGEFPAQMASNAENVSIWWRHHVNPIPLPVILVIRNRMCNLGTVLIRRCHVISIGNPTMGGTMIIRPSQTDF